MARLVVLVGKDESGKWSAIDVAEGRSVEKLLEKRLALRAAGLVIKKGKSEVKLTELRTIGNNTSGGELKPVIKG